MRSVFTKAAELIIKIPTIAVELKARWMMYHMLCMWQRSLFTGYMTLELQPHQINYLISIISKDLLNWAARRFNLAPSRAGLNLPGGQGLLCVERLLVHFSIPPPCQQF